MQWVISFVLALLVGTQACLGQAVAESQANAVGSRWHGAWKVATPEAHGFNAVELDRIANEFGRMQGVYSFLLISRGDLLVERYYRRGHRDKPHNLKSAGKSLISVLIGIAADKGYLRLDQPIAELLTEARAGDPAKGAITVDQLLTMTSGLETTSYGGYNRWIASDNWVKAALELPLVAEPGTFYQYSTGNTHLLSAIITAASDMSTLEFANRYLFGPMDIEVHDWQRDPQGIHIGGNNLLMTPRDMAKIGLLFLDGGRWGDQQLVSQQWIERSTRSSGLGAHEVYGTHSSLWWTDTGSDDFAAVGFGGQYIYVSRECDCVIVITSTLYSKGDDWTSQLFSLIRQRVLRRPEMPGIRYAVRDEHIEPTAETLALRHALERARSELSGIVQELGAQTDTGSRFETTARVNFRSGPDQSADLLGLLENGVPVNVISRQDKWFKVRVGDRVGWLHSDFIGPAAISLDLAPEIATLRRALNRRSDQLSNVPVAVLQDSQEVSRQIASERDLARAELATLQESVARLRESLARTQSGLGVLQDEAESTTEALQLAVSEKQVLEVSLERNRQTITILEDSLRSSNTKLQSAEDDLAALRSSGTERLTALRSEAQSKAVALEEALAGKQAVELALENERERTAMLEDSLKLSNAKLNSTVNDLQAARDSAEPSLNQLSQFERSNSLLKRRLEEKDSAVTASESQRTVLAGMLSDATAELTRLQSQLEQAEAVFESDRNLLETEIAERISVAQRAESARKAAVDQLTLLQSENQSQTEALQRGQSEKAATDASLVDERQRIARLEAEIETSNAKLGVAEAGLAAATRSAAEQLAILRSETQSQTEALQRARSEKAATDASLIDERQRIARLEGELETSNAKLGAAEIELAAAKITAAEQLAILRSENQSKTAALEIALSGKAAADAGLVDEHQRIARLEDELEASTSRLGAAEARLATETKSAADQLAILRSENQSKSVALQTALSEKAAVDAGLVDERQRIARLEDELNASNVKLSATANVLGAANESVVISVNRIGELEAANSSLHTQLEAQISAVAAASAQRSALADQLSAVTAEVTRQQGELDQAQAELTQSQARLAVIDTENKSQAEQLTQLLAGSDRLRQALVQAESKEMALQDELGDTKSEVATLKSALQQSQRIVNERDEARAELATLRDAVATLQTSLARNEQALDTTKNELATQLATVERAESARRATADELTALQSEAESQSAALKRAQLEKTDLETDWQKDRETIAALEDSLSSTARNAEAAQLAMTGQLDRLRAELASTRQALEQANVANGEATAELAQLRQQGAATEAALADARGVASAQRDEAENAQQRIAELAATIAAAERQRQATDSAHAATLLEAAERETLLRKNLVTADTRRSTLANDLSSVRESSVASVNRIGELEAANSSLHTQLEAQTSAVAAASAQRSALADQLSAVTAEVTRQQGELDQAQAELTQSQARLAVIDTENKSQAEQLTQLLAGSDRLRQALVQAESKEMALQDELGDTKSEVATLKSALQQSQRIVNERDEARAELATLRDAVATLQTSLARNEQALDTTKNELATQVAAVERAESARRATADELAALRSEAQLQAASLQRAQQEKALINASLGQERERIVMLTEALDNAAGRAQTAAAALGEPEAEPIAITRSGSARASDVSESGPAAVGEVIQIWSKAWSDQDVATYLAAYADDFVPEGGQTIDSWKALRRSRLNAPEFIEVSVVDLAMEQRGAKVVASFLQTYRSNTYSDQTRKVLELTRTADGWRIVREYAS